ncbi:Cellular nucleic acid-binding protein [Pleurostoma richardsiae]|uniref:Cellular nucleic acid-binding protein n=1 Tax=Pleurostoma richardsiae TaxID=41990 RepID=A0AA38RT38_9PEZI|nr:Cellular nucleic acid-binding protein [Pleurostoma richardsiae]
MSWESGGTGGGGVGWNGSAAAAEWKETSNTNTFAEAPGDSGGKDFDDGPAGFDTSADNGGGQDGFDSGGGGDVSGDRACFNCGESGHNKADCPNPKVFSGACRVCNKEGHMSKDCPNRGPVRCFNCHREGHSIQECPDPLVCPRCGQNHLLKECPMPMKCRHCSEEGHMGKDCPTYVETCENCGEPGHTTIECKAPRKLDRSDVRDADSIEAWVLLQKAIKEQDVDDVKEAVQMYCKALPDMTYVQLEQALRNQDFNLWLIPLEKAGLAATLTNMDLQGNLDKKYTVNYRFNPKPQRPREREGWPADEKEILERLADAGEVVARLVRKCTNCNELGHISKHCTQEKMESERPAIKCYNCDAEGHRVRDCPVPRVDKFACKNCGQPGHKVADCTEPRKDIECRKCGETGHMGRDCPQGGGSRACHNCGEEGHMSRDCTEPRKPKCRNCDELGHVAKECSKPRDMTRVKCMNCQEMGHFKSKCPNPLKAEDDEDSVGDASGAGDGAGDNFTNDFGNGTKVEATGDWKAAGAGAAWEANDGAAWKA